MSLMCPGHSNLLRAAKQLLKGARADWPIAKSKLSATLKDPEVDRQLDELDRQFYLDADGLWDKL